MMDRKITVRYSPDLIKFAVWQFWIRSIGRGGFISFALVSLAFIYFLLSGDRSWLLGFLGSVAGLCLVFGVLSYTIYLNRSMEKFKRMETPEAKFRFTDDRIGIESDIGWAELSWKMIEKVWKFPKVWLVFIAKQGYITLPTADIDEELQQFITRKIQESGGTAI
ncbi:MAG TPA: YcxB family protein [Pyrinomonadaceae bacterium]|jgi:hypothetical protein|nr:YcxB family protein [Pyrinomonadaceae bacterium]